MGKLFNIICEIFQKQNLYVSLKKRRHKEKNHTHGPNAQMCMPAKIFDNKRVAQIKIVKWHIIILSLRGFFKNYCFAYLSKSYQPNNHRMPIMFFILSLIILSIILRSSYYYRIIRNTIPLNEIWIFTNKKIW